MTTRGGKTGASAGFREKNARKRAKEETEIEFVGTETEKETNGMSRRKLMIEAALRDSDDESADGSDSDTLADAADSDHDLSGDDTATTERGKRFSAGSFRTMNLIPALQKAIVRKGYRQPTPIQRKCIGPLLEGRDLVGMARTGSGKTAAFILPLVNRLKAHSVKVGVRALVLGPTRELALQTFHFIKTMTKFTDLRSIVLVGGDGFEEQFASLASNPDIIVATPGRLLHLCIETKLSLNAVETVVFDEADRLFEMGFAEQLHELLALMPSTRQTALFSATLPRSLVDFASAGLSDPLLIRLDTETKLSEDLRNSFLAVQTDAKDAMLLYLLKHVIKTADQLTIVFAATKHHVEYLQALLRAFNFSCGYIYGSLDQEARELALSNFRSGLWSILIVTDVAARGIDVPLLDNVINYDFPGKPKLFVHRVGRVARAGRSGTAYSLVAPDEVPYLVDLQLFLGHTVAVCGDTKPSDGGDEAVLGTPMQEWIDQENEAIRHAISTVGFLEDLKRVTRNAYKLYYKTRAPASPESHATAKRLLKRLVTASCTLHPIFSDRVPESARVQAELVSAIRGYKPRQPHLALELPSTFVGVKVPSRKKTTVEDPVSAEAPAASGFRDDDYYLPYTRTTAVSAAQDRGYAVKDSFMSQANEAVFDLGVGDDLRKHKTRLNASGPGKARGDLKNVDRQKLNALANQKRIKTEHGTSVPATFKTDMYQKWQRKTHLAIPRVGDTELNPEKLTALGHKKRWVSTRRDKQRPAGKQGDSGRDNATIHKQSGHGSKSGKPSFGQKQGGKPSFGQKQGGKPSFGRGKRSA